MNSLDKSTIIFFDKNAKPTENEKTGLICDGNSLEEIYSSIDKLLREHRYKEYGKIAKEFSYNFHWNKIIESYKMIMR